MNWLHISPMSQPLEVKRPSKSIFFGYNNVMSEAVREVPLQSRARERVDKVIEATKEIIVEEGYSDLTLSLVCKRAGIKQTSIYRYWPNKQSILSTLASHFERDFQPMIESLVDMSENTDWRDIIRANLQIFIDYIDQNPWFPGAQMAMRAESDLQRRHEQMLSFFAVQYAHLLRLGGLVAPSDEEARIAHMIVLIFDSFLMSIVRVNRNEDRHDLSVHYANLVIRYLEPYMASVNEA